MKNWLTKTQKFDKHYRSTSPNTGSREPRIVTESATKFPGNIFSIIDTLIDKLVIDKSFDKSKISVDYFSKSKQGDISTNLLIILRKFLIN